MSLSGVQTVALLVQESPTTNLLVRAVARRFPVSFVAVEKTTTRSRVNLVRNRAARLGWAHVASQLAFLTFERVWLRRRTDRVNAELLRGLWTDPLGDEELSALVRTVDINGPVVRRLLEAHTPAVVVVSGTSILWPSLLKLAPAFLNIHCGITPAYRGVHGAFWAIHEKDADDMVGVTVHRVAPGVDTGAVVAQASIPFDPRVDDLRTLATRQYLAGIPLMVEAVGRALAGERLDGPDTAGEGRQWYGPTLGAYVRFRWRFRGRTPAVGGGHSSALAWQPEDFPRRP